MFYTNEDIKSLMEHQKLVIESTNSDAPFDIETQVGTGSIDLRIGDSYRKFKKSNSIDNYNTSDDTELFFLNENEDLILQPNEIVLINTLETVFLCPEIGAFLTGRSKYSRLGLLVEVSQNFINPGYKNPIPLQLVNLHHDKEMRIKKHSKVAQIIITEASSPATYHGDYSNTIINPEPSKAGIEEGTNTSNDFDDGDDPIAVKRFEMMKRKFSSSNMNKRLAKNEDAEFGKHFAKFVGQPDIIKPASGSRTTGREDIMTYVTTDFLDKTTDKVKLLDLCCGYGIFPHHLITTSHEKIKKIAYHGIDSNNECIEHMKLNYSKKGFADFKVDLANITDRIPFQGVSFDVAFFINSLHEISPEFFPDLFQNIFKCLKPTGKLIIIDMAELPVDEGESIAINWEKEELEAIFESCNIKSNVSSSNKIVNVTTSSITPIKNIDKSIMFSTIKTLLENKRRKILNEFVHLELDGVNSLENKKLWLYYVSLTTRISLTIQKINEKTKRNGKN